MWLLGFLQDGKHGKAWGIVHKDGQCLVSYFLKFLHLFFHDGTAFAVEVLLLKCY